MGVDEGEREWKGGREDAHSVPVDGNIQKIFPVDGNILLPSLPGQGPKPAPVAQQQNKTEFGEAEQNLCS